MGDIDADAQAAPCQASRRRLTRTFSPPPPGERWGLRSGSFSYRLFAGVIFSSLVLSAVLGGLLVTAMVAIAPSSLLARDPVLQLVLMLESAVPSAINLLTLASMNEHFVYPTGRFLFLSYLASAVTIPAAAVTYVVLLDS